MKTPLEIIESYGSPTDSYIAAVTYFRYERSPLTKEEHEQGIADILGSDTAAVFDTEKEAEVWFMYTVQETIRAFSGDAIPDLDEVWAEVQRRVGKFMTDMPWAMKDYSSEIEDIDDEGKTVVKQKKGAKKEQAIALYNKLNDGTNDRNVIVTAFMDEIGMSKAGATTYFHNFRKEYGFSGPKTERVKRQKKAATTKKPVAKKAKKKGPTKGQIAREVYASMPGADKKDIIAAIVEQAGTTPAGANTYYCAAKKEAGE